MESDRNQSVPSYCQVLRFKDSNGQMKEMIFPKALDLDRPKRPRTTFSESQLASLETEFQRNPYLIGKERTRLAMDLGLSETQVKVWFQNRRTKSKRSKMTADESSTPPSPISNSGRQSLDEESSKPYPAPTVINQKSDAEFRKDTTPSHPKDSELKNQSLMNEIGFTALPPYLASHPNHTSHFDLRPICTMVGRPFPEFMPTQQFPTSAGQQFLVGQLNGIPGQSSPWTTPNVWFPWSNQGSACFQHAPMK